MIPHIKTMTIDGFYTIEQARDLSNVVLNLPYVKKDFGEEIENFNMVPEDADEIFSNVMGKSMKVDMEQSGIFRIPSGVMIHFESFNNLNDWIFAVAIQDSTINIFEHQSGSQSALDEYNFNYNNLFEWDLTVSYLLQPGQGIFIRPWMFHAFDSGLIQIFRLREENANRI
jgi:hypothetical protein